MYLSGLVSVDSVPCVTWDGKKLGNLPCCCGHVVNAHGFLSLTLLSSWTWTDAHHCRKLSDISMHALGWMDQITLLKFILISTLVIYNRISFCWSHICVWHSLLISIISPQLYKSNLACEINTPILLRRSVAAAVQGDVDNETEERLEFCLGDLEVPMLGCHEANTLGKEMERRICFFLNWADVKNWLFSSTTT